MSFRIYTIIKSIFAVLTLGFLTVSCSQKEEFDAAVGYLYAPDIDIDVVVEDMLATKAGTDVPTVEKPAISEVYFVVKNETTTPYEGYGLWTSALVLQVGDYTITATYGSKDEFNKPYFYGEKTVSITALCEEKPSLAISLANSMVKVSMADELAKHFQGTPAIKMGGNEASLDSWYYVPAQKDLAITISGKNAAGEDKTLTHTLTSPQPKNAYRVQCNADATDIPTITLPAQTDGAWNTRLYVTPATTTGTFTADLVYEISTSADFASATPATQISGDYYYFAGLTNGTTYYVRARIGTAIVSETQSVTIPANRVGASVSLAHYNDASGNLAGTNATLTMDAIPSGIIKTLVDGDHLKVEATLRKGSTTYRTASASGTMSVVSGWPYIPQGSSYELTVDQKLTSESTAVSQIISSAVVSSAPTFTVTLGNSYSSYDEAVGNNGIAKNVANANTRNAETIYAVSASGSVAEALMTNANYTKTALKVTLAGTDKTPTGTIRSCTVGDITGLTDWKAYELVASMTFDGVTKTAKKTHHITGLPYNATPPTNSGNHPWTAKGSISWNSDKAELYYSAVTAGTIITPTFYVPTNIDVSIYTKIEMQDVKVLSSDNVLISKYNATNSAEENILTLDLDRGEVFETSTPLTSTMSSSFPSFYIKHDIIITSKKVYVYYFRLNYR